MTTVHRVPIASDGGTDYTSAFELRPAVGDARGWAISVFGDAPGAFRFALRLGWRFALRLRLDGPRETLGWVLDTSVAGRAVLRAEGPLLIADNRVDVTGDAVIWTTSVTYRTLLGRLLWSAAAPIHHRTLPWLMRRVVRR